MIPELLPGLGNPRAFFSIFIFISSSNIRLSVLSYHALALILYYIFTSDYVVQPLAIHVDSDIIEFFFTNEDTRSTNYIKSDGYHDVIRISRGKIESTEIKTDNEVAKSFRFQSLLANVTSQDIVLVCSRV